MSSDCYGTRPITVQRDQTIILTSPNYPSNYNNNDDCVWLINTDIEGTLLTHFVDLNTESCCDFISIGYGSNPDDYTSEVISTSGSNKPVDWRSPGSEIWVKWYSDSSVTRSGWNLTITYMESEY